MSAQPVALVTGTSSGIGLHTALGLAAASLHVVATMRDPGRGERLRAAAVNAGLAVEIRPLDVVDAGAAADCVEQVLSDHGAIDVLVNNAGRGLVGTLEQVSLEDLRAQLELNYVAVAGLTRLVLPAMRQAGSGRIITVSSVGGAVGQPFADAYCGAKFAVEGLMQSLAPVAARFGVQVCIVEPAAVGSEFVANVAGVLDDQDPADPYADLLAAYLRRSAGAFASAQTPADAAAVVVEAATATRPKFRWQTSPTAAALAGLSLGDLDGSRVLDQTATWLT
ncbi:MAG: SDR family NAD(P)-dependent oxidoreductase [Actinomycetota bacterium]|nr:SDR family NAD(P)-dependent oxidoreductase [Actinomycetota bacterium]